MLAELRRRTGLSDSELLRKGIQLLARSAGPRRGPKIVGLGRFESGRPDLGSNETHLRGFGQS